MYNIKINGQGTMQGILASLMVMMDALEEMEADDMVSGETDDGILKMEISLTGSGNLLTKQER